MKKYIFGCYGNQFISHFSTFFLIILIILFPNRRCTLFGNCYAWFSQSCLFIDKNQTIEGEIKSIIVAMTTISSPNTILLSFPEKITFLVISLQLMRQFASNLVSIIWWSCDTKIYRIYFKKDIWLPWQPVYLISVYFCDMMRNLNIHTGWLQLRILLVKPF